MSGLSDYLTALNRDRGWSTRAIEREAERHGHKISYATASRYLNGTHPSNPSDDTLQAFADIFGVSVNAVRRAANRAGVDEPFDLGADGARLTGPQREAVRTVVRLYVEQNDALADRPVGDGATTAPEDIYGLAALKRPSEGKRLKREADMLGEESQDPGTDDPA